MTNITRRQKQQPMEGSISKRSSNQEGLLTMRQQGIKGNLEAKDLLR